MTPNRGHCLNCGAELQGPYCHICGQPASVQRLTMRGFIINSVADLYHANARYIPTAWRLLTRPWRVIADYINCRRSRILAPIPVLVFSIFIKMIERMILGSEVHEKALASFDTIAGAPDVMTAAWYYLRESSLLLWLLLIVPSAWLLPLFFRKNSRVRYNFAEYTAAGMYLTTSVYLLSIITLPFNKLFGGYILLVPMAYAVIISVISIGKAFDFKTGFQRIVKTVAYLITVPVIYLVVLMAVLMFYIAVIQPSYLY